MGIDRRHRLLLALTAIAAALQGCVQGGDYRRPELAPPPPWSAAAVAANADIASPLVDSPFDGSQWWHVFNDPLLDSLVQQAGEQNLDLQTARLRIAAARAQVDAQAGAAYPSVSGNVLGGRTRMSENGIAGALGSGSGGSNGNGNGNGSASSMQAPVSNLFQVGFDATWELDLWGKVQRSVEAARGDASAAIEQQHEVLASLRADLAHAYIELRGTERQLAITRAQIADQERAGALIASRQQAGFAAGSDVAGQAALQQGLQAQLPPLLQRQAQARNRLALLLNQPPGALDARLQEPPGQPVLPARVPTGLPGELLRRRPDVRRAEAQLQAATARVGAARARLFPSLTLALLGGLQAQHLSQLDDWGSRFFIGGGQVMVPLFQGGQLRAQVRMAGFEAESAAIAFRQAVLAAYHDADNTLIAYGQQQRRNSALQTQLKEASHSRALSLSRFNSGLVAYSEVLDANRSAQDVELQLAQSDQAAATALIAVFKALGGGWDATLDGDTATAAAPR